MPRRRLNRHNLAETRAHDLIDNANKSRRELRGLVDELQTRVREISADPYLTAEEKKLRIAQARDEAESKFRDRLETAHENKRALADFLERQIESYKTTPEARERVRDLLRQNVAPGVILRRARNLSDHDAIAALRDELLWRPKDGRGPNKTFYGEELDPLMRETTYALLDTTAGTEGGELRRGLDLVESPILEKTAVFTVRALDAYRDTASGGGVPAHARLELAYATSDLARGDSAGIDGDAGDGPSGDGADGGSRGDR